MGRTIGLEFKKDGLYLLDTSSTVASPVQQVATPPKCLNKSSPKELLQWHNRIGHSLLLYFKRSFLGHFVFILSYVVNLVNW